MFLTLLLILLVLGCVYVLKNRNLRTKWPNLPCLFQCFARHVPN